VRGRLIQAAVSGARAIIPSIETCEARDAPNRDGIEFVFDVPGRAAPVRLFVSTLSLVQTDNPEYVVKMACMRGLEETSA